MHNIKKIGLIVLCCWLAGILNAQNETGKNVSPKIAVIQLKISRNGDDYNIVVKDVTVISSEMKRPSRVQNQANTQNGLVCLVLDKSNVIIDSLVITDPLVTRYEYPKDDSTIGSKEVVLEEKDVIIRTMYNPDMEYLRFLKVMGKTTTKSLSTLKLPMPGM